MTNTTVTLIVQVKRFCEHAVYDNKCIWCKDALRIAGEIKQKAENKSHNTVVKVIAISDTQEKS
jgi:hypothetical protein